MGRMKGVLVAVVLACATAAACGGGGGSEDVATLGGDGSTSTTTGDGSAKSTDPEDAMVAFTSCMREHGVDLPDPEKIDGSGGGFAIRSEAKAGGASVGLPAGSDATAKAAQKACGHLLDDAVGNIDISAEEEAKMRDQALAFASCMREHGVDMPDPTFDASGGGNFEIRAGEGNARNGDAPPFDDPDFEAANEACADKLGGPKGGPGLHVEDAK